MFPDNAQNHTGSSTSLPPVAAQPQQAPSNSAPLHPSSSSPSAGAAEHYALQARQLIVQYANDPYRLCEALIQLKAAYLSEQYHITTSKPGS
jgi:hypothetical protein